MGLLAADPLCWASFFPFVLGTGELLFVDAGELLFVDAGDPEGVDLFGVLLPTF